MLCVLPAARAGVAHAELVALGVGHDHPPAAVLGSGVPVRRRAPIPSRRSTSASTSGVSMSRCMRFLVSLASPTRCRRNLGNALTAMPAGRRHRPLRVVAVRAPVPRNGPGLRGPRSQGPARSSLQPRADPPTTLTGPPARARPWAPGLRYRSSPRSGPRRRPAPASGSAATLRLMSAGRQDEARSAGQPGDEPGGGSQAGQVRGHAGHQRSDGESGAAAAASERGTVTGHRDDTVPSRAATPIKTASCSVSEQRPWHGR